MLSISIVIPAYNEEEGLPAVLDELAQLKTVDELETVEIIIVDDHSMDKTYDVATNHPINPVVLKHSNNRGYGAALKTGIAAALHPIICIIDADGTYPPSEIIGLVKVMTVQQADMVVGARTGADAAVPLVRRPAKTILRWLSSVLTKRNIPDLNSGLRLFPASVARQYDAILPDGFSFTTTITMVMLMNGYHVVYQQVPYLRRTGSSKIKPIRDTLNFLQLILRIGLYFAPLRFFGTIFLIVAIPGLTLFLRFIYFFIIGEGDGHIQSLIAATVLIVLSFQSLLLGLLADFINANRRISENHLHEQIRELTNA